MNVNDLLLELKNDLRSKFVWFDFIETFNTFIRKYDISPSMVYCEPVMQKKICACESLEDFDRALENYICLPLFKRIKEKENN